MPADDVVTMFPKQEEGICHLPEGSRTLQEGKISGKWSLKHKDCKLYSGEHLKGTLQRRKSEVRNYKEGN